MVTILESMTTLAKMNGIMEDSELFGERKENIRISIDDSENLIKRGLRYFFGDRASWIPEYDKLAEWLKDNQGKGLLCCGDGGRGKTFVCERILLPIIMHKHPYAKVSKVRAYTIARDYNEAMGTILFIDDIGVERDTHNYGERINVFNQIVDDAERNNFLLIVTTNLTLEDIREKYGERTLDRLRALTRLVLFKGESLRNKK